MRKKSWFIIVLLALIIIIPLINDVTSKYYEIKESSPLLGAIFLGSIFILLFLILLSVYGYIREIFLLENAEKLKDKLKEAIEKKDRFLIRKAISEFFNFYENFYYKKYGTYSLRSLRKEWELERKKQEFDEMLKLLHKLEQRVLLPKDKEAERIIKNVAIQTAVSTAISPVALLDALIMFWRSWFLVKEIAKIYGFRPNFIGTLKLFRQSIQNMAISASVEVADDVLVEVVGIESIALERISKVLLQAFSNGILILRFGYSVIDTCRPIPLDKTKKRTMRKDLYLWFVKEFINSIKEKATEKAKELLPEPIRKLIEKF
ncbi:MAG: YcjF family protein [Desulfurobacteriaceae bacterium]